MRRVTPEAAVKIAVCQLLDLYRIRYHRLNAGLMRGETNGKKWAVRMAPKGTADLLALPRLWHCCQCFDRLPGFGKVEPTEDLRCDCGGAPFSWAMPVYIETKRERGGVQSPAQKAFQAEVEADGFAYLLARSTDDVVRFLKGAR